MSTGETITVLNPMGFAPKVVDKPLAPRLKPSSFQFSEYFPKRNAVHV